MSKNRTIHAACLLAAVIMCAWAGAPVQAAAPVPHFIPCGDTAGLVNTVNAANLSAGLDILHLAPNCVYLFTEGPFFGLNGASAIPVIKQPLAIYGHGATLLRSYAKETLGFRLLSFDDTDGLLIIDRLKLENGNALQAGGAIISTGPVEISRSVFVENHAYIGGALYLKNTAKIDQSLFANNQADYSGGAVGMAIEFPNGSGSLIVTNTTFTQNRALNGSALLTNDASVLQHNTIVGNTSLEPGVLSSPAVTNTGEGTIGLRNTILDNNLNDCNGLFADLGGNLQSGTSCGNSIKTDDPILGELRDNGGPTNTMAPEPGSPAIDLASVGLCTLPVDQRGAPRGTASCDSGAYESGGMITGQIQVEPDAIMSGETARVKITLANHLGNAANNLSLKGLLPNGLGIVEVIPSADACAAVIFDGQNFGFGGGSLESYSTCSVEFVILGTMPGWYILQSGMIHSDEGGGTDLFSEAAFMVNQPEPQFKYVYLPLTIR